MKKNSLIVLLGLFIFIVGCSQSGESNTATTSNDGKIDSIDEVSASRGTLHCTRSATATNATPFFEYTIDYKNGEILRLHSIEGITSEDSAVLDEYEDAYKKISSYYTDLKYYDTDVIRNSNKVTWDTTINYEKIDINSLLALEGEEDNIIKDGKASLEVWLELAKKVGTTCVEE